MVDPAEDEACFYALFMTHNLPPPWAIRALGGGEGLKSHRDIHEGPAAVGFK
jgi:hypothetical protein